MIYLTVSKLRLKFCLFLHGHKTRLKSCEIEDPSPLTNIFREILFCLICFTNLLFWLMLFAYGCFIDCCFIDCCFIDCCFIVCCFIVCCFIDCCFFDLIVVSLIVLFVAGVMIRQNWSIHWMELLLFRLQLEVLIVQQSRAKEICTRGVLGNMEGWVTVIPKHN